MLDVTFRVSLAGLCCPHLSAKYHRGLSFQDTRNRIDDHTVPAFGINDDESCFTEGRNGEGYGKRYMGSKPTHVQWAPRGAILAGPITAWLLGLVIAASVPNIKT